MNRWTLPLLLLTACGGTPISQTLTDGAVTTDAVSTLDGGAGGLPIEQLGATLIQAACESLLRCPATGDNATVRILFSSVPNCVASVQTPGHAASPRQYASPAHSSCRKHCPPTAMLP